MKHNKKTLFMKTAAIAVILNVVLSSLLSALATPEEVKPANGPASLSLKSQVMHMLVHHKKVLVSSSLLVGLVAGLSCWIACRV